MITRNKNNLNDQAREALGVLNPSGSARLRHMRDESEESRRDTHSDRILDDQALALKEMEDEGIIIL